MQCDHLPSSRALTPPIPQFSFEPRAAMIRTLSGFTPSVSTMAAVLRHGSALLVVRGAALEISRFAMAWVSAQCSRRHCAARYRLERMHAPSRPIPDCFAPQRLRKVAQEPGIDPPRLGVKARRPGERTRATSARPGWPANPYGVSLARVTASSSVVERTYVAAGPKDLLAHDAGAFRKAGPYGRFDPGAAR